MRRANTHAPRVTDHEHERQYDAACDQQPALDEAHVAERPVERGREQQHGAVISDRDRHLREPLAVHG